MVLRQPKIGFCYYSIHSDDVSDHLQRYLNEHALFINGKFAGAESPYKRGGGPASIKLMKSDCFG